MARSIYSGKEFEQVYEKNNFIIEETVPDDIWESKKICAIYCSSSGLYFPNTLDEFVKAFIDRDDKYELMNHKLRRASKHIYIRDIVKEFYIWGINKRINSMDKLIEWLSVETKGYDVYTFGSSGGGYAAAIIGATLNAKFCYCFSGFFDLNIIDKEAWPLVDEQKYNQEIFKYYRLEPFIQKSSCLFFYFYPENLKGDVAQAKCVEACENVIKFPFATKIHGIPWGNIKQWTYWIRSSICARTY